MVSAWRNFKNIFSRPLYTIIFRPDMLKFHSYSILTGDTMVGFVIYCVLSDMGDTCNICEKDGWLFATNSIPTSRSSASPSSSSPGYSSRGPLSPYCAKIPELRSLTSKALGKSRSFWLACSGNTIPELTGNPIPELPANPIPELMGNPGRIPREPIPHSQLGISLLNPESRPVQLLWKNKKN